MADRCPHLKALQRMHRALYPELHDQSRSIYEWHAETVEHVAAILNDALGFDDEGRNAEQQAAHHRELKAYRERLRRG